MSSYSRTIVYKKVAILSTSSARRFTETGYAASNLLLDCLAMDFEVYIVSTRQKLFPDGADEAVFRLIPEARIFSPDPEAHITSAESPALINVWLKLFEHLGIQVPEDYVCRTWLDLRNLAKDEGIYVV